MFSDLRRMKAIVAKLKSHFTNWREWELNPIVVKELRQAVRSWAVTGMLFLFLIVLLGTGIIMLVSGTFDNDMNAAMGASIFSAFSGILTLASVVFIPLYIRSEEHTSELQSRLH